nr:DUF2284 domain-containing protein [uncultured Acetatifactor sp.]
MRIPLCASCTWGPGDAISARSAPGWRTIHPCRFPDMAISSLEAHGINVSRLAAECGMKYINGQNTVTYFGAVLCSPM